MSEKKQQIKKEVVKTSAAPEQPKQVSKKYLIINNMKCNGVRYKKGQEYELSKEVLELAKKANCV